MKKYLILAAAALSFAACSSDDALDEQKVVQEKAGQVAVDFDAYVPRTTSRAGYAGVLDATALKTQGFGVFAYYTNADNYDQNFTPNFMYNQEVTYSSSWTYSPVKYWPNEFGNKALSDDKDKISFFAYAPYVAVKAESGKVTGDLTMGIVGMKRNNDTGDPMVKYISTFFTDKQVDLTWGTMDETGTWSLKNTGTQAKTEGMPWLDIQQPKATTAALASTQPIKFDFKHGLAALNVQVLTDVDKASGTAADPATGTKVFIRSVTFEGFDTKGALNLNNASAGTALWYSFDCQNELNNGSETTIFDGRKDGKEGLAEATKEYKAINPDFIQSDIWANLTSVPGVTSTVGNLFCKADGTSADNDDDPIFVIPNGDKLKITIEYDVLTSDPNLAGKLNDGVTPGSVVKNVITRYITTGASTDLGSTAGDSGSEIVLANGKKYTITLRLGLNSVVFDAKITDWAAATGGATLPHNN